MADDVPEVNRRPKPSRYYRLHLLRKLVKRLDLPDGSRFLEIGCGSGMVLEVLVGLGLRGVGVDLSAEAIEAARTLLPAESVELVVGDFRTLDGEFGLIVAAEVLEHIEDDVGALRWMRDHLADGGHVLITVPGCPKLFGERDRQVGHHRRYGREELRDKLLRAGLEPQLIWTFGPRVLSRLFRLLSRRARKRKPPAESHGTEQSGYAFPPHERKLMSRLWPLYSWLLPLTRLQAPFLRTRFLDANCIALCKKGGG